MPNDQMNSAFLPSQYFPIVETLYGMCQPIKFRQHNPNKPVKWGLLYKSLNDAPFLFTYQIILSCRKPVDGNGECYLSAAEDYVKHLVESMPLSSMQVRNIFMDSL